MQYNITKVHNHQMKYPDHTKIEFLSVQEYKKIAQKLVLWHLRDTRFTMGILKSEDALAQIVHCLAMADWRFDESKGLTRYQYRNYCGYLSIKSIIQKSSKKNKLPKLLLHFDIDDEGTQLYSILPSKDKEPIEILIRIEEDENAIYLVENSKLTDKQKECVKLRMTNLSFEKIGQEMGTSKEAASTKYKTAVRKMIKNARLKSL